MTSPPQTIHGKRVELATPTIEHASDLLAVATTPEAFYGWPLWGQFVHPMELVETLRASSDRCYTILATDDGAVLGYVQAAALDLDNGTCYVDLMIGSDYWRRGWVLESMVLMFRQLFADGVRKVYLKVSEEVLPRIGSLVGRLLQREAVLPNHVYAGGRYLDVHILALYRESWDLSAEPSLARN